MKKVAVIIVAGGSGSRMESDIPKQFMKLCGRPILMRTIDSFLSLEPYKVIVALPDDHVEYWSELCKEYNYKTPHTVCIGGETRFNSVKNALSYIGGAEIVAVHDGVRPLVSADIIRHAVSDAEVYGAVIPVVRPVDSLRMVDDNGSHIVHRADYRIVQTPQVFDAALICKAYKQPFNPSFTDDASVIEADGGDIYLCEGSYLNIKITTPVDMLTAEALLGHLSNRE